MRGKGRGIFSPPQLFLLTISTKLLTFSHMNPLQYIVSTNGLGIAIGICGNKKLALQDATLAENIYGSNHNDSLFNHLLYMPSLEAFKKFLIVKEYFCVWDEHFSRNKGTGTRTKGNVMQFTRRAIKRARLVMDSQVTYENFMQKISNRNQEYMLGAHQDEQEEE